MAYYFIRTPYYNTLLNSVLPGSLAAHSYIEYLAWLSELGLSISIRSPKGHSLSLFTLTQRSGYFGIIDATCLHVAASGTPECHHRTLLIHCNTLVVEMGGVPVTRNFYIARSILLRILHNSRPPHPAASQCRSRFPTLRMCIVLPTCFAKVSV